MTDTAKQMFDSNLYQEEEDDYEDNERIPQAHHDPNNEYGLGDNYMEDEDVGERRIDCDEEKKLFQELLFCIQGVGSIKKINGYDVYVKHDHCEESLKDILSSVRKDGAKYPVVKLFLGQWEFLKKDLIPLLVFHHQDKRLSFIACMIIFLITQMPDENCTDKAKYMEHLRQYKECFIQQNVIQVLIQHLADCLQIQERNQKHEQMIELIICIFKQLLIIPEDNTQQSNNTKNLQKRLLLVYGEENVLDSFIFMTQEFTHPFFQKMSVHFLEIWYQIFKNFTPSQIYKFEDGEKQALEEAEARERSKQKKHNWLRGMRHGKFGSQIQIYRDDGSSAIFGNIYSKSIDVSQVNTHQRRKAQPRMITDQKRIIEAPQTNLVNEVALESIDKALLKKLRTVLIDFLQSSYCPLIDQIFNELTKGGELIDEFDKFHYFKLSSFMMQICRLQAYENQKSETLKMQKNLELLQAEEDKKNLFNINKKQQKRVAMPKVPFHIDITLIGASLQLSHFEFLYATLFGEFANKKESERRVKDFHSALQLMTQFLNVIRDMASSDDEKNKKNAQILLSNVFHHDMVRIAQTGFLLYKEKQHHKQFLHDTIEFTHLMVSMLDEYSKGKVLTVQTNKVRKAKKSKKRAKKQKIFGDVDQTDLERMKHMNDEDMDEDYNPNKVDDINKEIDVIADEDDDGYDSGIMDNLSDDEDDYEQGSKYVERNFNFKGEISLLVDYQIITRYMNILRDKDYMRNPQLLACTINWFKRVINQLQATWIFFQLEYLMIFDQVLNENACNNNLMRSFNLNGPVTAKDKQIETLLGELKTVIINIMRQFFDTFQKNSLLGIECLYRFPSKEIKDQVLSNYDNLGSDMTDYPGNPRKQSDDYEEEEEYNKQLPKKQMINPYDDKKDAAVSNKDIWTEEQDSILIDNFDQFKQLGKKTCCDFLSHLIEGKSPKECYKRIKVLGLNKKDANQAREKSKLLNQKQNVQLTTAKMDHAVKKFILTKIGHNSQIGQQDLLKYFNFINEIQLGFSQFKEFEEQIIMFGSPEEINDLTRAQVDYSVVAVNKHQFDMLNERAFVELLSSINVTQPSQVNMMFKISTNVSLEFFNQTIDVLLEALSKLRNSEGFYVKEQVESFQIEITKHQQDKDMEEGEDRQKEHKKKHKHKKDSHKKSKKHKKHRKEREDSNDEAEDELKQMDDQMQSGNDDEPQ